MSAPSAVVVAIDGPAGTGKSTVARLVAQRLGLPYLDTGAMYRALALFALDRGIDLDDPRKVAEALSAASIELRLADDASAEVLLGGAPVEPRIRTPEVAAATSRIAVHPEVRARMVALQRSLAAQHGGVIEGRDIGTRVVPETPHKFYLLADPRVRAQRRLSDLHAAGRGDASLDAVERELGERDARDASREHSPLTSAADAVVIDTSQLDIETVVDRVLREIRRRGGPDPSQEGVDEG